jgi:hypothetical protein
MDTAVLTDLAARIEKLSSDERLWLLEHIARSLRRPSADRAAWDNSLAAMAADPDIRRGIRAIADEFEGAEADCLGER